MVLLVSGNDVLLPRERKQIEIKKMRIQCGFWVTSNLKKSVELNMWGFHSFFSSNIIGGDFNSLSTIMWMYLGFLFFVVVGNRDVGSLKNSYIKLF